MRENMLSDRQLYIIKAIVELYAKHGEPIGSKTLIEFKKLDYSSATIRNDMKALEMAGLLEKTHTSSGRIPSEKGYRFYVDNLSKLLQAEEDTEEKDLNYQMLFETLDNPFQRISDIIQSSAKILSTLTNYTAFILGPEAEHNKLISFRVTPIANRQMMAIIVTDNGRVENLIFQLPPSIDYSSMVKMVRIIEEELVGQTLYEVYRRLNNDIPKLIHRYAANVENVFQDIIGIFEQTSDKTLYVDGELNLIDFMKEENLNHFKSVYQLLDDNKNLLNLLAHNSSDTINVRIGGELEFNELSDFSLITADYNVKDYGSGIIAILGPTNMAYQKNIQLIEAFQNVLPVVIERYYQHHDD